jgi:methylmalonyl-CoA mutase, C-terminal domain
MREQHIDDVVVAVGGTIPTDDVAELLAQGVAAVFTPGTPTETIVEFVRRAVVRA